MKKIMVMYTSVGLGHKVIAENIAQALRRHPELEIKMLDVLEFYRGPLTRISEKIYLWILLRIPRLWGFFYTSRVLNWLALPLRRPLAASKAEKMLGCLSDEKPDLVLTTQTTATAVMSYLKGKKLYQGKLVTTFSDYHFQPFWVYPHVDRYLGIIPEHEQNIRERGEKTVSVVITGMPVDEAFVREYNIGEIAHKYGLSKVKPLVLVMGGSRGWGIRVSDIVALLDSDLDIQIAVVCGTNRELAADLKELASRRTDLHIMENWSNQKVAELYSAAKVLVTKPGGLTVAQALARGLPLVLVNPLPTMEEMNQEYLVSRGLAVEAKHPSELRQWIERLFLDQKYYQEVQNRMKEFGSPRAAEIAAAAIIDILNT